MISLVAPKLTLSHNILHSLDRLMIGLIHIDTDAVNGRLQTVRNTYQKGLDAGCGSFP